jgi:hypothetical protein
MGMTKREFLIEKDFNNQPLGIQADLTIECLNLPTHPNQDSMFIRVIKNGKLCFIPNDELSKLNTELFKDFPRFEQICLKLSCYFFSEGETFNEDKLILSVISEIREEILSDIV